MSAAGSKNNAARADGAPSATTDVATAALEAPSNPPAQPAFREPGSYRDRHGAVFYYNGEIFRGISAKALANWQRLGATRFFGDFTTRGSIVPTKMVSEPNWGDPGQPWTAVLKHESIPFVSYPYEWTFGMLKDAALLHLELMLAALEEDFILKDSSPYNVQWDGARPVFIDIPSFEVLEPGQPWVGYRQFCELFLYPLMLHAYKGVDFRPWLRGSIGGISAASLQPLLSLRDLMRPGVAMHVVAHNALQRRYSGKERNVRSELAEADFDKRLIVRNVLNLRKIIYRMAPGSGKPRGRTIRRRTAMVRRISQRSAPSFEALPVSADGSASGTSAATPAPSRGSPPNRRTMWSRWMATGWLWSISTRARRGIATAARSCLLSSTSRIPHPAKAGGAWSANPCRTGAGRTSRSALR
ncbi:hypothetical protein ACF1BQ_037115 [Bradyrhizobium sp. RDT10]